MTITRSAGTGNSRKSNTGSLILTEEIAEFCKRWKIGELALFGSILHQGFKPDSDVDFLVSFTCDADRGLPDHMRMQQELESIEFNSRRRYLELGRSLLGSL